ncbi:hypothetical protein Ais01nite_18830 [Asanoa ishikariensis]|uniref:Uncharacterized protein n=1 Tax=Asanoa ishikariensis TaxID=137265 RepID=A0A1H3UE40_9ACTN|nr:hypothetical protein [Asanoa ishikariensis]GIF63848.1 hypothetical protein Ais01nite_18830 [Asanoa ishikariensis]SDZ60125.1 hypothetical protein SAMN05421684_6991 [Asanoa ishikariensis]
MRSHIEKPVAVGGAALAVTAAVAGVTIAGEQLAPTEVAAKVASFASALPVIEQADLVELMTSDDSVLATAVQAARNMGRTATLGFAAHGS